MVWTNGVDHPTHKDPANLEHSIKQWANLLRFEVRQDDRASFDDTTRDRCEIVSAVNFPTATTEMWFSYAMRLEPGSDTGHTWMVVGQIHAIDTLSGANPWWACELTGDVYKITSRFSTTPAGGGFSSGTQTNHYSTTLTRGKWYRIVHRIKAGADGTGILQSWINGAQVVNLSPTAIGYSADTAPYFKLGIYRSAYTGTCAISYANVEISSSTLLARVTAPPIIGAAV